MIPKQYHSLEITSFTGSRIFEKGFSLILNLQSDFYNKVVFNYSSSKYCGKVYIWAATCDFQHCHIWQV